jgi:drug/metabolite transporter (DMT)-like permease
VSRSSASRAGSFFRAFSGKGLIAISLWGASFVFTRIALRSFNPFGLVAIRLLTGSFLLFAIARARGGPMLPARADVPVCTFLGLVLSLHLLIQAYGLQYTSAIHTGWIIGFIPVTIALGAHLLGKQRIARVGWVGVAVGAGGVLIVTSASLPGFAQARLGDLLQVCSCLTWTVYTLAAATPVARSGALRVTALGMGVAAIVVTVATAGTGLLRGAMTLETVLALGFLGFLCSGWAYYLWFQALIEHGPARVGSLLYLEPFVTLGTAAAMLREPVTGHAILGGGAVLFGVWLVAKGARTPQTKLDGTTVAP